ncbi:MAG: hypothetical protein OEV15_06670 [Gallionella sp.]|nr:hypothetical protein [Gallionella sp.]
MNQSVQHAAVPIPTNTQTLATHNLAQYRAFSFVSDRIAEADASQWHGGYIHGLNQALVMAGAITVEQGCKLEQAQDQTSCNVLNRRAAGGAA